LQRDWHSLSGFSNLQSHHSGIDWGRKDFRKIDQQKLEQAAKFSGADEFITSYDQLIWKEFKDGIDLSKGQHQRLAVARMFYRNAPLPSWTNPLHLLMR